MSVVVELIGAGPGDLDLVTVGAVRRIKRADVVVYDYLSSAALLGLASDDAEKIFVGKKGFTDHVTQDQINDLLVEKARQLEKEQPDKDCHVVRLKGGDPFVFGRGGEEALALDAAGIPFEVVPGVTSGIAAPAYAGIPVTHRKVSSSVAFITGNEDPTKEETAINWDELAHGADTLCFYMGIRNLSSIADSLMAAGRDPDTPVALVRWGTTSKQETLTGTLATIAYQAEAAQFKAPAIIVVGDVVGLREQLAWFERKPLLGRTIAVTRTREQAGSISQLLRDAGAEVVECPSIRIEADEAPFTDDEVARIHTYDWIVFTSANGVDAFFHRLFEAGYDTRDVKGKVAVIGSSTAKACRNRGICADLVPGEYRAEALAQLLVEQGAGEGSKLLLARAEQAREVLPEMLRQAGATVDVLPVYKTVLADGFTTRQAFQRILSGEVDGVTLTSSSTAVNFCKLLDKAFEEEWADPACSKQELLDKLNCYSIGPITTATAESLGLKVVLEPSVYTVPALVDAIIEQAQERGVSAADNQEV